MSVERATCKCVRRENVPPKFATVFKSVKYVPPMLTSEIRAKNPPYKVIIIQCIRSSLLLLYHTHARRTYFYIKEENGHTRGCTCDTNITVDANDVSSVIAKT